MFGLRGVGVGIAPIGFNGIPDASLLVVASDPWTSSAVFGAPVRYLAMLSYVLVDAILLSPSCPGECLITNEW